MLELEHLQKSFDGVPVLKDISLQVEDGEIVSILGPSGCGKTTLLNMILGIVDADQGAIRYNGEDLTHTPMEKRGFNIVFQDYALFPNLNVQQNTCLAGYKAAHPVKERRPIQLFAKRKEAVQ